MQHPEEGIIHAWLDGALSPSESAALEGHVESCAECASRVAEARGLIAASSRIVGHLDAVPGGVVARPPRKKSFTARRWVPAITTLAAAAVIFAIKMQMPQNNGAREVIYLSPEPTAKVATAMADSAVRPAPVSRVEPRRTRVAEAPPAARGPVLDTVVLPPIAQPPAAVTMQKSASTAPQSAAAPTAPATRDDFARNLEARVPGASSAGLSALAVTGTAGRAADTAGFVGCYERSGVLTTNPARLGVDALDDRLDRFALTDEIAATPGVFAVRRLDTAGRPEQMIPGTVWTVQGGRAVLKGPDGKTLMTFIKTGSTVRGVPTSGDRSARVISCR